MTNQEFDILDNLYFLTSFNTLAENCGLPDKTLKESVWGLIEKEWVLCHQNRDEEINPTKEEFESTFSNYHYLASKKGLLAHNAR